MCTYVCVCVWGSQVGVAELELSQCMYKPQGANTHEQTVYKYTHMLTKYKLNNKKKKRFDIYSNMLSDILYRPQHCHKPHTVPKAACTSEYLTPHSKLGKEKTGACRGAKKKQTNIALILQTPIW